MKKNRFSEEQIIGFIKEAEAGCAVMPQTWIQRCQFLQMARQVRQHGILAKIRDSAGQEIEGACGQLRARAVTAK